MAGLIVFFLALTRAPGLAAVISTNGFSDAFVTPGPSGNLSLNNYGGAGALGISAAGLPKGEFQSVITFDSSAAQGSFDAQFGAGLWNLQSAFLQLTAAAPNNGIFNNSAAGQFQVFWMQNNSWGEGTGTPAVPSASGITFSSLQGTYIGANDESLGVFSFDGATSGAASYPLNLTPGFSASLRAGNNVTLRIAAADANVSYLFDSRNFGTSSARPQLTLAAVPEPSAIFLALLGVGTIAFGRRGRRGMD